MTTVLRSVTLPDGTRTDLVMRDGLIVDDAGSGADVLVCDGLIALPGLVDVHTHLGYTALRGMFGDLPYSDWKRAVLRREVSRAGSAQEWY